MRWVAILIIESRNLPGFEKMIITLFYMIPVYCHLSKDSHMWCNLMLIDISNEFKISQIYSSAFILGVITPTNKIVITSQTKDVHFRLTPWGYTWGGPNVSET